MIDTDAIALMLIVLAAIAWLAAQGIRDETRNRSGK